MTWNEFWARIGLSFAWFAVLEIVNAVVDGSLPHWLAALAGLALGFLGTWVFILIIEGDSS